MDDRSARLAPLLRQTYEAALDPATWRPLAAGIAAEFGGAAAIYAHDPVAGRADIQEFASFQPEFIRSYAHYGGTSPWLHAFRQLPVGTLLTRSLAPALKLETTEYYNDWLKPQNLRDALGGILGRVGATGSYVTVIRAADRSDFSERDKRDFRPLLDALIQAVRVHARLARAEAHQPALYEALDRAGLAAFAVNANGRLAGHNRLAEELLRAGRAVRSRGGGGTRRRRCRRERHAAPRHRPGVPHSSWTDRSSAATGIGRSAAGRAGDSDGRYRDHIICNAWR